MRNTALEETLLGSEWGSAPIGKITSKIIGKRPVKIGTFPKGVRVRLLNLAKSHQIDQLVMLIKEQLYFPVVAWDVIELNTLYAHSSTRSDIGYLLKRCYGDDISEKIMGEIKTKGHEYNSLIQSVMSRYNEGEQSFEPFVGAINKLLAKIEKSMLKK